MKLYIGFDIGGTKCSVVLGNEKGEILDKLRFDTVASRGPEPIIADLCHCARELIVNNKLEAADISCGAISCGGPLDSRAGVIKSPPNLPGWDSIPVCDIIGEELGIRVFLQNDANASALAEWKLGAGRGCSNMIFLTFGTGMGAGLILGGRLYSGANDLAGEVGHIRVEADGPVGYGKAGSFEGFCSGAGIAKLARVIIQKYDALGIPTSIAREDISAKTVAEAAFAGDAAAKEIYRFCGAKLGKALAILVDVLNPERIVIGSIFERSGELLRESTMKSLTAEALPLALEVCKIVPAQLGDKIGDYAALTVAMTAEDNQ